MAKSRTKFYSVAKMKKDGRLVAVGKAFRFKEGTIFVHLDRKSRAKTLKLTPCRSRSI